VERCLSAARALGPATYICAVLWTVNRSLLYLVDFRAVFQACIMLEKALCTIRQTKKKNAPSPFLESYKSHPSGYPRLSERIAIKPETGIYRRFDALNARRILYLQAELCILEGRLQRMEERDNKDEGKSSEYATDYQTMLQTPLKGQREQLELVETMQRKLEQYSQYPVSISISVLRYKHAAVWCFNLFRAMVLDVAGRFLALDNYFIHSRQCSEKKP
jgi:hypothetical protein